MIIHYGPRSSIGLEHRVHCLPSRTAVEHDARTDLVLVDENHNLTTAPGRGRLAGSLKCFTEHLPATFIYAGIDVERCGALPAPRASQLAGTG